MDYQFRNPEVIIEALTHRSHYHEHGDSLHNERLEFLGDSVLNLCVTQKLVFKFKNIEEGKLSKLRSHLVSEKALAVLAEKMGLGIQVRLGKGEESSGGRKRPALLADTFEAVLGAVFVDGGFEAAQKVVYRFINIDDSLLVKVESDYKSRLQELCQQKGIGTPSYRCLELKGPDHNKSFVMGLFIGQVEVSRGEGRTKKVATQQAAQRCLSLGLVNGAGMINTSLMESKI